VNASKKQIDDLVSLSQDHLIRYSVIYWINQKYNINAFIGSDHFRNENVYREYIKQYLLKVDVRDLENFIIVVSSSSQC
jgi:hypothetical protein